MSTKLETLRQATRESKPGGRENLLFADQVAMLARFFKSLRSRRQRKLEGKIEKK